MVNEMLGIFSKLDNTSKKDLSDQIIAMKEKHGVPQPADVLDFERA